MRKISLEEEIKSFKTQLTEIGQDLLGIADKHEVNKEIREVIVNLLSQIRENFMFVIVGEVNAGKSSFVNALVGADICATAKEICTQEVQKIVYGETDRISKEGEQIIRKELPVDILKEITIVDTPGTNSREIHHQVITENFIPNSNLVIFVFQIDNPHVNSAWEFFRKIKDKWSKKIIFVLTKADTQPSPQDVEDYKNILIKYATEEKMNNPLVFVVSAKKESEGKTEESGYPAIRGYINTQIMGKAAFEKIKDDFGTLKLLSKNIRQEFDARIEQFKKDRKSRDEILRILDEKEGEAKKSVNELLGRFLKAYDDATDKTLDELNHGIGFWSMSRKAFGTFFGGKSAKKWLDETRDDLKMRLDREFGYIMQNGLDSIKSNIQYMAIGIKDKLEEIQVSAKGPKNMFNSLEVKRMEILSRLKEDFTRFTENSPAFKAEELLRDKVDYTQNVATGGGIAVMGAVLAAVTNTAVLDITGGVLTAFGLLMAGITITVKKNRVMREARNAIQQNRQKIEESMGNWLNSYINEIQRHINENFIEFDEFLKSEKSQIDAYTASAEQMLERSNELEEKILMYKQE